MTQIEYLEVRDRLNPDVIKLLSNTPLNVLRLYGHNKYDKATVKRARIVLQQMISVGYENVWQIVGENKNNILKQFYVGPTIYNCIVVNVNWYIGRYFTVQMLKKVEIDEPMEKPMTNNEQVASDEGEWLSASQAADLGIAGRSTIQKWAQNNLIDFKVGFNGQRYFLKTDLLHFRKHRRANRTRVVTQETAPVAAQQDMDAKLQKLDMSDEKIASMRQEWKDLRQENGKLRFKFDMMVEQNAFIIKQFEKTQPINWQLAETAPDDGTPILVYGNGEICTIRNYGEWHVVLATPVEDKMQITLEFEFTHWMPLPEGPK